jgi:hypothetical protein
MANLRKLLGIVSLAALAGGCYVQPAYGRVYYHRAYAPVARVYVPAPPVVVVRPVWR